MFCSNCGNEVFEGGNFCSNCGVKLKSDAAQMQSAQLQTQQPNPVNSNERTGEYEGSFTERLHGYGGSALFLTGIIMFSACSFFNILLSFNASSIFSLMYLALPVVGFWLIFASSKEPKIPEKTLPALTLFKIIIIFNFVISLLAAFIFIISSFILFAIPVRSFSNSSSGVAAFGFFLLLLSGGIIAVSIIYFRSVMKVIGSIRYGIINNSFNPLSGLNVFSILAYLSIVISILFSLIMLFSYQGFVGFFYDHLYELPRVFRELVYQLIPSGRNVAFSSLFSIASNIGIILCIFSLGKFNESLTKT